MVSQLDKFSTRNRTTLRRATGIALAPALAVLGPASALAQQGHVEFYHLDALGSVRLVTKQQGQVVSRHDFLPFGEEWTPSTPKRENRLFTGQVRDPETGLDYFGARRRQCRGTSAAKSRSPRWLMAGRASRSRRCRRQHGSGAWWKETGEFIGFLERYTPKKQ